MKAIRALGAMLLGQCCAACKTPCTGQLVCQNCTDLSVSTKQGEAYLRCPRCAVRLGYGLRLGLEKGLEDGLEPSNLPSTHQSLCGACITQAPAFDAARALGEFKPPLSDLIAHFKFGQRTVLARWFAVQLDILCVDVVADVIVPVPLHPNRLQERGYNQAWQMVKAMQHPAAKRHALQRLRDTPSQRTVSAAQRFANVRGAFLADESVHGLRVLLIDDVVTTTATVQAASKALKAAGAVHVTVACLARVSD